MGDLTTPSAEATKLIEMEKKFRPLLKKGYLTDVEFQKLICIEKIDDRKSEIDIMMVKDQFTAVKILNVFKRMTSKASRQSMVSAKENNGNHVLLNAVVADCIFAFLPINDVLNCRLVCQQWKTASSNTLRKRVTINFRKFGLEPSKCFKVLKKYLPDIQFQSFEFWTVYGDGWDILEIEKFFDKRGAIIKSLKFQAHCLFKENQDNWFQSYDITHWIHKACNLTKLDVDCYWANTKIEIQLSKISSVKFISMRGSTISIDDALKENIQIKPVEIILDDVTVQSKGSIQKKIRLNDVIDFSQATEINLLFTNTETKFELDMMSQIFNTKRLQLVHLKLTNWTAASGKISFFYLCGSIFVERNGLQIEQLFCEYSTVDFSALPKTMEKLHFSESKCICSEEIDLPQLKYLRLDNGEDYPKISFFNGCAKLVELELGVGDWWTSSTVNLNLRLIPKSVKRLKINCIIFPANRNEEDDTAGENSILNLDTLILENYLHRLSSEVSQMMSIIKPKVLVASCCDRERVIDTTSICDFLLENKQLKKIIVGSIYGLHKKTPFELSVFARFVGRKKSDYYEFENRHGTPSEYEDPVGMPISEEEFDLYRRINGLDGRCYTFRHDF